MADGARATGVVVAPRTGRAVPSDAACAVRRAHRSCNQPFRANAWIWVSPVTDERLADLAPRVRMAGFDVLELPIDRRRGLGLAPLAPSEDRLAAGGLRFLRGIFG